MIDTHAHLDFENFDEDREAVIRRAFDNGVKHIINVGVDLETSRESIALAEKNENISAAVGFHPHDAQESLSLPSEDDFEELKNLAKHKKVVAIGEIGLDYTRLKKTDQIEKQKELFIRQLNIARELNLPAVIHCREAWEDLYEIIFNFSKVRPFPSSNKALRIPQGQTLKNSSRSNLPKFVLHCYSGDKENTKKFLELPNIFFSFSGNITFPKPVEQAGNFREVIKTIPLDRLMLDSDSPLLAPQAKRGKRNEPAYTRYIAEKIAEIKEISVAEAEKVTDENAKKFFRI